MMIEQATVIAYQNGIAQVQCQAKQGCGGCSQQSTCGTKALSALAGEKTAPLLALPVPTPLAAGDKIEIGLAESSLLASVWWLYTLPLLAVVLSTLLLSQWIDNELIVAIGIIGSTAATFIGIKHYLSKRQQVILPVFLRKL